MALMCDVDVFHVITNTLSIFFVLKVSKRVIVLVWHLIPFTIFHIVNSTIACPIPYPSIIQRWVNPQM